MFFEIRRAVDIDNVVLFSYFRYVSSNDLKKALAMLGFKASKAVLGNMISRYTSMDIF